MKVIAINDAPTPENGYHHNGVYLDKAYYKGDIFDVLDPQVYNLANVSRNWLVIHHDKLNVEMEVNSSNFIPLNEWRNSQINKIL